MRFYGSSSHLFLLLGPQFPSSPSYKIFCLCFPLSERGNITPLKFELKLYFYILVVVVVVVKRRKGERF
jgi:hypothetical protein